MERDVMRSSMENNDSAGLQQADIEPAQRDRQLAEFVVNLDYAALPADIRERTVDLVLDHIGVSIHSANLPWSTIIGQYALDYGSGKPEAMIYGRGRVTAPMAALCNGTIAHGVELDDTHDRSCSHPGAVIMPAVLAVAESIGSSGPELITAAACGYEVQARLGAALTGTLLERGFHPTALTGVFGACTAAAKLLRLDSSEIQSAWGLAASMASGVMQFTEDAEGTMVKRLHGGFPSHNGVLAAQLAKRGFRGPFGGIDGRYGVTNVFTPEPEPANLSDDLNAGFEIGNVSVKFYACCRLFHALVDAILSCTKESGFDLARVTKIVASGPKIMSLGHMQYRPKSMMSAQYSLPFSVAVALCLDPKDTRSFNSEATTREDILAIADLVTAEVDPELEALFPAKFAGAVRFHFDDGRTMSKVLHDSIGTPASPADRSSIEAKFRTLTDGYIDDQRRAALIAEVYGLTTAATVRPLADLLVDRIGDEMSPAT